MNIITHTLLSCSSTAWQSYIYIYVYFALPPPASNTSHNTNNKQESHWAGYFLISSVCFDITPHAQAQSAASLKWSLEENRDFTSLWTLLSYYLFFFFFSRLFFFFFFFLHIYIREFRWLGKVIIWRDEGGGKKNKKVMKKKGGGISYIL